MSFGLQDTEKSRGNWIDASSLPVRLQVLKALGRMLGRTTINNLPSCGTYKIHHQPARHAIPLALKGDCYGYNSLLVGLKPTL